MPCRPRSPILGHSSRGKRSVLSSSAAIGATWSAAKRWTWSRSASAVSPSPKSKGGIALGIMSLCCLLEGPARESSSGWGNHLDVDAYQLPFAVGRNEVQVEVDAQRLGGERAFHQEPAVVVDTRRRVVGRRHGGDDVEVEILLAEVLERKLQPVRRELIAARPGQPDAGATLCS